MSKFKASLKRFLDVLDNLSSDDLGNNEAVITDFSEKRKAHKINLLNSSFNALFSELDSIEEEIKPELGVLKGSFEKRDFGKAREIAEKILENIPDLPETSFRIKNIPMAIKDEINADLEELEKCFKADCFRASVILCGRLLETALHRKYYDATGLDILEKNPGIGLGTIVAKMKQKNIALDPAVQQQIHLINQVRIYSVHRKKEAFNPTKEQTQAIILYTIDVVKRLF